jgi:hypothetical protein
MASKASATATIRPLLAEVADDRCNTNDLSSASLMGETESDTCSN